MSDAPLKEASMLSTRRFPLFISMWDCFTFYFFPCKTRGGIGCIGCDRDDGDALIA